MYHCLFPIHLEMENVGFLSLAVLVILSTATGRCPEQESCSETYSHLVKLTEPVDCSILKSYLDCLAPCGPDAAPFKMLDFLWDGWCNTSENQKEQVDKQGSQHVKLFLDMLNKYSNGSDDDLAVVEELGACKPFLQCLSQNYIVSSDYNITGCSEIQALLDCWRNTTDNCTFSENLIRRVDELQDKIESECLEPVEVVTMEAIQEEVEVVSKTSPILGILNDSLSPVERNDLELCPAFSYCEQMLQTNGKGTSDYETYSDPTCRLAVPGFRCLVSEMESCDIQPFTMLKFHRMIGYVFVYCKMITSASRDKQEKKMNELMDELKTDSSSPACDELLTCAGDAEISKIQRLDRQAKCIMLQDANECFQDNIDACPKGELYKQMYDENQSEEEEQCVIAGCRGLIHDNKLLTTLTIFTSVLVASILGSFYT